jgi:carbonic anhydrase
MQSIEQLLENNKLWANGQVKVDPDFFKRLEALQSPEFLWIGCSDSRVPANQITGTQPGEVFVHRNIANLVLATDLNALCVLQFSVDMLKVEHIIVCGHYGCGGIQAAMTGKSFGMLDQWLIHIKDVYDDNKEEVDAVTDPQEKLNLMVELNVLHQVRTLSELPLIKNAWKARRKPTLNGWVYSLGNGIIKPLIRVEAGEEV